MVGSADQIKGSGLIGTLLDQQEFEILHSLYLSKENESPKFGFPDLISACVSLVFEDYDKVREALFKYVRTELTLRNSGYKIKRRKEDMWNTQYLLIRSLQVSSENHYPHPKFDLGDFTTACIALASACEKADAKILNQARKNLATRHKEISREGRL